MPPSRSFQPYPVSEAALHHRLGELTAENAMLRHIIEQKDSNITMLLNELRHAQNERDRLRRKLHDTPSSEQSQLVHNFPLRAHPPSSPAFRTKWTDYISSPECVRDVRDHYRDRYATQVDPANGAALEQVLEGSEARIQRIESRFPAGDLRSAIETILIRPVHPDVNISLLPLFDLLKNRLTTPLDDSQPSSNAFTIALLQQSRVVYEDPVRFVIPKSLLRIGEDGPEDPAEHLAAQRALINELEFQKSPFLSLDTARAHPNGLIIGHLQISERSAVWVADWGTREVVIYDEHRWPGNEAQTVGLE